MGGIRDFLKTQALTRLPDSWLRRLRRLRYERTVRVFNEDDEPDLRIVRYLVPRGTTAIDLGANIGAYTKILSSLTGPTGRVVAVEPVPETFDCLTRNVQVLRMMNVTPMNAAVSDRSQIVTVEVPENEFGGPYFTRARVVKDEEGQACTSRFVRVHSMTLDEITSAEERVAFIKCDIEGHELQCLAGAESVIAKHHPAWLIEVWGNPDQGDSRAADVFEMLGARGYSDWFFDGTFLRRRRTGDQSVNYFFLTAEHVSHLRRAAPSFFA